ncbi:MAG: iron-sulfur cluster repair di-iron protein [Lutibacter sp.]|nr:iron-sulfur cluster repair di-iron protein [Lutibacter sp.]
MSELKNKTIAEIVSDDISTASVFKKYKLDFCCGGGKTVEDACEKANINVDNVVNDLLNNTSKKEVPNLNFKDWSADFLADYIVYVHHTYLRQNLPIISEFADKVAKVHGQHEPKTIEIAQLFSSISSEMTSHMRKEEFILFPAIKAKADNPHFEFDEKTFSLIKDEHEEVGILIKKIQELSSDFTPPEWACNTFKALYFKLEEFTNDLYQHIHLENNILFPKVKNL